MNGPDGSGVGTARRRICAHVLDIDLAAPLEPLGRAAGPDEADRAWVLVRWRGEPMGQVMVEIPESGVGPEELGRLLRDACGARLARRQRDDEDGVTPFPTLHQSFLTDAPPISVVVCTRERPEALDRCLGSLAAQDHPRVAVWVVDNAPRTSATREVVSRWETGLDVRYVCEPRPGLSRARNRALAEDGLDDVVAWIDDDETADPRWLGEVGRAFAGRPEVTAVSGLVIPAELVTQAQVWFEEFGGHSKGRGVTAAEFSPRTWATQHPLFPLPPFGTGANMAFRTRALREVGGFDPALGAGTMTRGSEDTKIFTDLLLAGHTTRYVPSAVTRHYHREDLAGLRDQMVGYGEGLTAFYAASILRRPRTIASLARLAPTALREVLGSGGARDATLGPDFPRELLAQNRRGMLRGPWLYLRQRIADRRTPLPDAGVAP